jgi:hypothetical protein
VATTPNTTAAAAVSAANVTNNITRLREYTARP